MLRVQVGVQPLQMGAQLPRRIRGCGDQLGMHAASGQAGTHADPSQNGVFKSCLGVPLVGRGPGQGCGSGPGVERAKGVSRRGRGEGLLMKPGKAGCQGSG